MYLNARSLINKTPLLENYVNVNKPTIVGITETWAKPDFPDGLYAIPGYQIIRDDRVNKRGGGVMLYLHKEIESSEIALHSPSIEFEYVCCKLHLTNSKFFGILCLYRPPNISSTGDLALTNLITEFLDLKFL